MNCMLLVRTKPAGANKMSDETIDGKYERNFVAIPPPREYPISTNSVLPVQDMRDDTMARRMQAVKKCAECGVVIGVAEQPRPGRSGSCWWLTGCSIDTSGKTQGSIGLWLYQRASLGIPGPPSLEQLLPELDMDW